MTSRWGRARAAVRATADRAESWLRHADELARVLALVATARTPLAYVGVGISAARFLVSVAAGEKTAQAWVTPDVPAPLAALVAEAVGLAPGVKDRDLVVVAGVRVSAYLSGSHVCLQAERDDPALAPALLGALGRHVRARHRHAQLTGGADRLQVVGAPLPEDPPAALADAVWRREAGFLRAGRTRVVMLAGPPGSGKSTVARALARRVVAEWPDATTLRVPVSDLRQLPASAVEAVLEHVRPDVLLLDDVERCLDDAGLLDMLEACHGRQRLVVATCNDPRQLSPAARRPRRVDDVWVVDGVGDELAARLLGPARADLVARVARWPVAYVEELIDRLDHVEGADVEAEVAELAARVAEGAA